MKIVILDGYAVNPGDLSWAELEKLGNVTIYDRTEPAQIVECAAECEIILTNKCVIDKSILEQLPKLKYIGVLATGYNIIDIQEANKRGIVVTNVPAYSTEAVAQMIFAHILNISRRVADHSQSVKAGDWTNAPDFAYWKYPQIDLDGKILGIIGYGNIGKAVARIGIAFGMKIFAKTRSEVSADGIKFVTTDELVEKSDFIVLCCPATKETELMINNAILAKMKTSAVLINTARGNLIDETALANALNNSSIAAAGIDVLTTEPPNKNNPLLTAKKCYISPHNGWATFDARARLINQVVENLSSFIDGSSKNIVIE